MIQAQRYRDLTIVSRDNKYLVIACDSCGGIGPKPLDVVQVPGYVLGRFLARTPLMELLSVGVQPFALLDTLCVEMNPLGQEIMRGIQEEAESIKGEYPLVLNGSTEDNILTSQTGAGIVVMGETERWNWNSRSGDLVIVLGTPKVGQQVKLGDPEICDLPIIFFLRKLVEIHEIVPVGSKGIKYELDNLLARNNLTFHPQCWPEFLNRSAGPSTCVLITMNEEGLKHLQKATQPITILGALG